jgi:hypothetical protein
MKPERIHSGEASERAQELWGELIGITLAKMKMRVSFHSTCFPNFLSEESTGSLVHF